MTGMSRSASHTLLVVALMVFALLTFAGVASAAVTVSLSGNTVTVTDDDGASDSIDVTTATTNLRFTDTRAMTAGAGCQQGPNSNAVDCPSAGVTAGTINLGSSTNGNFFTPSNTLQIAWTENGGPGRDVLNGGPLADTLNGGDGWNTYVPLGGIDTVNGGSGQDYVYDGEDAGDTFHLGGADDTVYAYGFTVTDSTQAADGADNYDGGEGNDTVDYELRNAGVTINIATQTSGASGETDHLTSVESGTGASGTQASPLSNTLVGDDGPNRLMGGFGADNIDGAGDADSLDGSLGNDTIHGGGGADEIFGSKGDDILFGDAGNDSINGWNGADDIHGGADDDEITGGPNIDPGTPESDTIDGEAGSDTISYADRGVGVYIDLGMDTAGTAPTTLNGGASEQDSLVNMENAIGGDGADIIHGNTQNNVLEGGGGTDAIHGHAGDDRIEARDDVVDTQLDCGEGNDTLFSDVSGKDGATVSDHDGIGCEHVNTDYDSTGTQTETTPTQTTPTETQTQTTPTQTNTTPTITTPVVSDPFAGMEPGQSFTPPTETTNTITYVVNYLVWQNGSFVRIIASGPLPGAAKVFVVSTLSKENVQRGIQTFKLKLNKKAWKVFKKRKKLKLTIKTTITPATGKAVVKQTKLTLKYGKPKSTCGALRC